MEIKEITNQKEWNSWLIEQNPNTFLQSWEWGQVQEKDGEKVRYLGMFQNEKQIGAALIITVHAKRGLFLLCPHGPVFVSSDMLRQHLPELTQHLKTIAKQDGAVAIRIAPLTESSEENTNAFKELGFRNAPMHIHAELTWVLNISATEEEIMDSMRKTTRHAVKKAQKSGVTVEISTDAKDIEKFWPLYEATKDRHAFVPFPKQFVQNQFEIFSQENRIFLALASYEGETVAAAILMHFGDTVFYYHGASTKTTVPAAQLLQFEAMKEAKRRGATHYNFWGIAPDDQPNHPFAGITTFKKGFGGEAVDYMHAQDLPTSLGYWKLWLVDTWRKKKRGF